MKNELYKIASNFRTKLEDEIKSLNHVEVELRNFPGGSCDISCALIGLYLMHLGYENLILLVGKRPIPNDINSNTHVWIMINDKFLIDITADQFEDCDERIIVAEQSNFHETFKIIDRKVVNSDSLSRPGTLGYHEFYENLIKRIERT